jgi:hypothetical protein
MNYKAIQAFAKNPYSPFIALFGAGFLCGFATLAFFTSECKTRGELCSLDLKEIASLRSVLKEEELKCIKTVTASTEKVTKYEEEKCSSKLKRIKDACNDLDCAQCRR